MPVNTLLHVFSFTLLLTLAVSVSNSPELSPSPSPQTGSDDSVPASPPSIVSPPAPPPSDLTSSKSLEEHSPSPVPSPAPAPAEVSDVSAEMKSEEPKKSSDGGMTAGKKVGVAFGLIAAACCVIFAGVLYRKRQRNIRRAQYSQSARLEFF